MTKIQCIYPHRDAVIAGYLYDDIEPADRLAFESHLATCRLCDDELASLRGVRETLAQWAPPEPVRTTLLNFEQPAASREQRATSHESRAAWWHTVPVWAQVAAAMLVFGASASMANLDVRYDRTGGVRITTGWSKPAPAAVPAATVAAQPAPVAATAQMSDDEFNRRARALLAASEKKQQQEMAVRLVQLQSEVNELLQIESRRTNALFSNAGDVWGPQPRNQQQINNVVLPLSGR